MNSDIIKGIKESSDYPISWQLSDIEIASLYRDYEKAISTMNGDTESLSISARQLILLLRFYVDNCC